MFAVIAAWIVYFYYSFRILTHEIQVSDYNFSVILIGVMFLVLVGWTFYYLTAESAINRRAKRKADMDRIISRCLYPNAHPAPKAPASAPAPKTPSPKKVKPAPIVFRVAGVTFRNGDGTSRQAILRHMKFGESPWAISKDQEDLNVYLIQTEYEGEPAIEVHLNDYQVGYVPKKMVPEVSVALNSSTSWYVSNVQIVGGGTDEFGGRINFGCKITMDC